MAGLWVFQELFAGSLRHSRRFDVWSCRICEKHHDRAVSVFTALTHIKRAKMPHGIMFAFLAV
ncbi:hypothetical protein DUT91_13935 [Phyllobacterium salinisoli]|uniref:Uncharacterized protein n=1 Tax=Phyllobacterium salinisoli TaxID=1899321 RepID=A0A368K5T7_9HYPH|nr:hypothetical protein DUT91_13935 [Phyllobacterium salinisoli]